MKQTLPGGPRTGHVHAPPSKSQAHRLLLCAALSTRACLLHLDARNDDIDATIRCLQALGAGFVQSGNSLRVEPIKTLQHDVCLDVGESGSTLRFLLPVLGALGVRAQIRMHGRLPERPLTPLQELLEEHGMHLNRSGDMLLVCGTLQPGLYSIAGNVSSQFISGLLFALPLLSSGSTLTVTDEIQSAQYIAMTEDALAHSGIRIHRQGQSYSIPGPQRGILPKQLTVEGDWSGASAFLCMGALSPNGICVDGLRPDSLQADRMILDVLRALGADVRWDTSSVSVRKNRLHGCTIDAAQIPDCIPPVAVLAACASGQTQIVHAERLRLKETDRLKTTARLIRSLGGHVQETSDGLTIQGSGALTGGSADACGDHRIAMSAAVAACGSRGPVSVAGVECVSKSYPRFWEDFAVLKGDAS